MRGRTLVGIALLCLLALLGALARADPDGLLGASSDRADSRSAIRPWPSTARPAGRVVSEAPVPGQLAPGSDPSVLPGNVLIADRANNRLLVVTPTGRVAWEFPRPGDRGPHLPVPDDAFFSPGGRVIVATQEDAFVVSVINVARRRVDYRYGKPWTPGGQQNRLHNPDDAMLTPGGVLMSADIKNCRLVEIRPPAHRVMRELGGGGACLHDPPLYFDSPNGMFPRIGGGVVITEINGDWVDLLDGRGKLVTTTHAPGFSYPSDTNMVSPRVLLSADYTNPGAVETFTPRGRLLWRYGPSSGPGALRKPSLALPLPNGDVLVNDDFNDRVVVIDPRHNRIVWQYGHTHQPGRGPGYLNIPDGVDLAPPHSLARRFPGLAAPPRR